MWLRDIRQKLPHNYHIMKILSTLTCQKESTWGVKLKKKTMIQMDEWLKINLEAKQLSYKTLKDHVI